jgi:hypothetical protein
MTGRLVAETVADTKALFTSDLVTEGLIRLPSADNTIERWEGRVLAGAAYTDVRIELGPDFPFKPPRVFLPSHLSATGWHRELDGALCLWTQDDGRRLPWLDAKEVLQKAEAWLRSDLDGWVDAWPGMDLEGYLPADAEPYFVLIDDWAAVENRWFALSPDSLVPRRLNVSTIFESSAALKRNAPEHVGFAVEVGELTRPIRAWDDLAQLLSAASGRDLRIWATARGRLIVVVSFTLKRNRGLLALALRSTNGSIAASALWAADATEPSRALRGGLNRADLSSKSVAIVGVGALGSRVADELARAGVGKLHLIDSDFLMPGNLVRHLCSPRFVGMLKAAAVKATIERSRYPGDREITCSSDKLRGLTEAVDLLKIYDLVVDATADGAASHLLLTAAEIARQSYLSVAVEGHGQFARLEVVPLPAGEVALPTDGVAEIEVLVAGGCGDPVSPTPPSAVTATAGLSASMAINVLRGVDVGAGLRQPLGPVP